MAGRVRVTRCGKERIADCFLSAETELVVQSSYHGICQFPHLSRRQLATFGNIGSVKSKQVISGDEGLVERGQQVGVGLRVEIRQHLQQIRHGPNKCRIGAALRMARATSIPYSPFRSNVTAEGFDRRRGSLDVTRDERCSRMFEKLLAAS
jgi:hypothetical protein